MSIDAVTFSKASRQLDEIEKKLRLPKMPGAKKKAAEKAKNDAMRQQADDWMNSTGQYAPKPRPPKPEPAPVKYRSPVDRSTPSPVRRRKRKSNAQIEQDYIRAGIPKRSYGDF